MATYTWTGLGGDGLFSTAGNWQGGVAPPLVDVNYSTIVIAASTKTAVIPAGATYSGYNALTLGSTAATPAALNILGSFVAQSITDNAGGTLTVGAGGNLSLNAAMTVAGTFNDAGTINIQGGITVGGAFNVTGVATVAGAPITINGTLDVAKGAVLTGANSLIVNGTASFEGTYNDSSAFIGGNGTFNIDGGAVGSTNVPTTINSGAPKFVISQGGSLYITNASSAASIAFGAAGSTLNTLFVPSYVSPVSAPITNFGPGDAVELSSGQVITSLTPTANGDGTYSVKLNVSQYYSPVTLSHVTLGAGVTPGSLTVVQNGAYSEMVACFYAGTRLRTPDGEIAVEDITAGTLLLTAAGEAKPVRWLGRSAVAPAFADPLRALPIRIKAGALGGALPRRDLLLSPCHAVLVEGVLAQAGALVNGLSVVRETDVPERFTYYHVEVAGHELLLAEGAATESFIDNVDRMTFENWAEYEALGEVAPITEMDVPRARSHRQVPAAVRQLLAAQLHRFGAEERAA